MDPRDLLTPPRPQAGWTCRLLAPGGDVLLELADVWRVAVSGLWLEGAPAASDGADGGWMICCVALGPERVRLVGQPSSSRSSGA